MRKAFDSVDRIFLWKLLRLRNTWKDYHQHSELFWRIDIDRLFFNWRTLGNPTFFPLKTRLEFSIQMSRLFFLWSRDVENHRAATKRIQTFVNSCIRRIIAWCGLKQSIMNGCDNVHVRCWSSRRADRDLEMDWSNSPQAGLQHYVTNLNMEPWWEKETRTTDKHVAMWSGSRHQRNGMQLETIGKIGPGPECLVE